MEIKRTGRPYTVVKLHGKYCAVMILSEHDNEEDALNAVLDELLKGNNEELNGKNDEHMKQGISLKEAMKDMTPEQRERFLEERNRKFVNPLLDLNIEMLKEKAR